MPLIDTKAATNAQGFTPEEQAELDAAEQEDVPVEGEEPAEPEEQPEPQEAEAEEKPGKAVPQATEKAKPPAGYVTIDALHKERKAAQEARERAARLEGAWSQLQERMKAPQQPQAQQQPGQPPAQIPDFNVDPIGSLQGQLAQAMSVINELKGHTQQQTEAQKKQAEYNQFVDAYRSSVNAYTREAPDFGEAYKWLEQDATKEIEARYPGISPQDVQAILQGEEERIVAHAFRSGKNPAEIVYNYAKARGWKKPAPTQEENKLERLKQGQKAAASLGATKGAGKQNGVDNMTLEAYAELMESDPAKAEQMWPSLAKRGLFG